jgi:hypothetical protein
MALPFPIDFPAPNPADEAAARAFPATSRYHAIPTASYPREGEGPCVVYLRRRFCPPDDAMPLLAMARVNPGERLDQLTARTLGDPTQFWRVADANHALNPFHLAAPGRVLRVPVPRHTPQP